MKTLLPLTRKPSPSGVALVLQVGDRGARLGLGHADRDDAFARAGAVRGSASSDRRSRIRRARGSDRSCPPGRRRRCAGRPRRPLRSRAPRPSACRPGRRRLRDGDAEQALLRHLLRHVPRIVRRVRALERAWRELACARSAAPSRGIAPAPGVSWKSMLISSVTTSASTATTPSALDDQRIDLRLRDPAAPYARRETPRPLAPARRHRRAAGCDSRGSPRGPSPSRSFPGPRLR